MGEVWKNHLISLCRGNCDYAPAGFTAASDADRAGDVRRKHEAPDSSVTHGTRDGSQAGSWLSNQDGRRATGLFQRRGKQDKIPCFGLTGASGRAARLRGGGGAQRRSAPRGSSPKFSVCRAHREPTDSGGTNPGLAQPTRLCPPAVPLASWAPGSGGWCPGGAGLAQPSEGTHSSAFRGCPVVWG